VSFRTQSAICAEREESAFAPLNLIFLVTRKVLGPSLQRWFTFVCALLALRLCGPILSVYLFSNYQGSVSKNARLNTYTGVSPCFGGVMIGFNTLLRDEVVSNTHLRLVRHRDTRLPGTLRIYQLWLASDGQFELYQKIQRRPVFGKAKLIASFVVTPLDETLFVGLYEIRGIRKAVTGTIDPVSGEDVTGYHFYDLTLSDKLADYRGRLVIDWGPGKRSWVQLGTNKDKRVVEIHRRVGEPPFPGFLDFHVKLTQLKQVPSSWRITLSAVRGIYLLTNIDTGKQYVGSAQGNAGFWGRWEEYLASGHGGNQRMQDLPRADYEVSVLEVASSSADVDALIKMECRWKEKLFSRKFGLNAN
jgi:GIY-YIG catalytic domain